MPMRARDGHGGSLPLVVDAEKQIWGILPLIIAAPLSWRALPIHNTVRAGETLDFVLVCFLNRSFKKPNPAALFTPNSPTEEDLSEDIVERTPQA